PHGWLHPAKGRARSRPRTTRLGGRQGVEFDGTPYEQADVAPGALLRAARHRADRRSLLVRQCGPLGPRGILVSGDSPVAAFRGAASTEAALPFSRNRSSDSAGTSQEPTFR